MQINNTTDAEMGETLLQRLTSQVESIDAELGVCPDSSLLQKAKAEASSMKSRIYEALCKFYNRAAF